MTKEVKVGELVLSPEQIAFDSQSTAFKIGVNESVINQNELKFRPEIGINDDRLNLDVSGNPFDPKELMHVVGVLNFLGLQKDLYKKVIPVYVATAHDLNVDVNGIGGLILLGVTLRKNLPEIKKAGITRRLFVAGLLSTCAVSIVGLSAWYVHLDDIQKKFDKCESALPEDDGPAALPMSSEKLEEMSDKPFEMLDFFLRGGYAFDWFKEQKMEMFIERALEKIKIALPAAFSRLMSEPLSYTKNRLIFILRKNDFIAKLIELGFNEKEAAKLSEADTGVAVPGTNGVSLAIVNVELITESASPDSNLAEKVKGIAITGEHELCHNERRQVFTVNDKAQLISWLNEAKLSGNSPAEAIMDGSIGLMILFQRENGKFNAWLGGDNGSNVAEFDEVVREFLERTFRLRLDHALAKEKPTPFYSYMYPFYIGSQYWRYLNDKLGVSDSELTDALNSIRTGEGPVKNVVDLINLYSIAGRKNYNKNLTEAHVLKALTYIETAVVVMMDERKKYIASKGELSWDDPFTEYVCGLYAHLQIAQERIDEALEIK